MSEETYRALLEEHTGKRSAADFTPGELELVILICKALGFVPIHRPVSRAVPQVAKIRALWAEMARQGIVRDGSGSALNAWVKRMTARLNGGVGVAEVGWLDAPLAVKVLEALKKWSQR